MTSTSEIPGQQPNPVQLTEVNIGREHIDEYGHVNYKAYPKIFEAGQDDYMNRRGIGFDEIER